MAFDRRRISNHTATTSTSDSALSMLPPASPPRPARFLAGMRECSGAPQTPRPCHQQSRVCAHRDPRPPPPPRHRHPRAHRHESTATAAAAATPPPTRLHSTTHAHSTSLTPDPLPAVNGHTMSRPPRTATASPLASAGASLGTYRCRQESAPPPLSNSPTRSARERRAPVTPPRSRAALHPPLPPARATSAPHHHRTTSKPRMRRFK